MDLYTPATNPTGILGSMGVAHMVGEPGAAEELSRIGPRFPLMPDARIVMFGYEPNPPEMDAFERRSMPRLPAKRVRGRAPEAAAEEGELASTFVREVAGALGGRPDG